MSAKVYSHWYIIILLITILVAFVIRYQPIVNEHKVQDMGFIHLEEDQNQTLGRMGQPYAFKPEAYEENTNCSVHVFSDKKKIRKITQQNIYKSHACTLEYFKNYLLENRQLLGKGLWSVPTNGNLSMNVEFHPEGCYFQHELTSAEKLHECFRRKSMNSILVTGDSHTVIMRRMLDEFIAELNGGQLCKLLRRVGDNGAEYFKVPYIEKDRILTINGAGHEARCHLQNDTSFLLEKIAMVHVLDGSLRVEDNESMKDRFLGRAYFTVTKLEYLLKHYLPHKGFPNFWLFMLPFQHDSWSNSVEKIRIDLEYMMSLFKMYLPDTTTLVFLGSTRECLDLQTPEIASDFRSYYHQSRNQAIHQMNQELVRVLLESGQRGNMHVFLDVNKISCPVMCRWHYNGAHMLHDYYGKMIRYILESYCGSTSS